MIIPRSCTRNRKFKPPGLSAGRWVSPAEGSGFGFCFPASWTAFGVRRAASLPPLPGRPTGALAQDQGGYGGEARLSGCFRSWAPLGLTGPGGPVYAALAGRGVIRPANLLGVPRVVGGQSRKLLRSGAACRFAGFPALPALGTQEGRPLSELAS